MEKEITAGRQDRQARKKTQELSKQYMTLLATLPVVSDTPFPELYKMGDQSISSVNKGSNSTFAGEAIFAAAISSLVDFFGDSWTDSQLASAAEIMYSECHWFCFPELKHFVRKAKAMKFGKIYGKFTPAVLMEWAYVYNAQALEEREPYFRCKTNKTNWQEPENPVPDEQVTELFRSFAATLTTMMETEQKEDELQRHKIIENHKNQIRIRSQFQKKTSNE
jgi:hypothetical protein